MRSKLLGCALLAVCLLRGSSAATAAPVSPPGALEVPRVLTGDGPNWFAERYALAIEVLGPNVPAAKLRDVALSILAQWAHESARGRSEFCFNLGGWRARAKDRYFVARDNLGEPGKFRWTAYQDLPNAVADQLQRLHDRFPVAWKQLVAQPTSSAWVEQLGRSGYYTAKPADYARAWAMNRAELGRLVA